MSTDSQTLPARLTNLSAADVYSNQDALEDILTEIEHTARSITPPDVTTKAGREAISSLAYKIARSKTFLDEKLGKPLVRDWKAKAAAVDKLRKLARDRLDALKAEVRQPLTDYEQAEANRQARIRDLLEGWHREQETAHRIDPAEVASAEISAEITRIEAIAIVPELEERQADAQQIKDATLYHLHQKHERAKQVEAERERIAQEEEAKRQAEREAYAQRIAEQAAAKAKQQAEQAARAQLEQQRRAHQAQLEALQRKEREAEAARWQAERNERRAAEAKSQAERDAQEAERKRHLLSGSWPKMEFVDPDEPARRKAEADNTPSPSRDRQAQIHREVLADLCDLGIHEATARSLITAIARGDIPHLSIQY